MAALTRRYAFIRPDLSDVEVSLPGVANGPAAASSFGVLKFGKLEVELTESTVDLLPDYFTTGSASPEDEITLSTGLPVIVGHSDGIGGGHRFGIKVGGRCLLGHVPSTMPLDVLVAWLSDLQITPTESGLKVSPTKATWSEGRTPNIAVGMALRSGQSSLLDIRPAFRGIRQSRAGVAVQGGYLSRHSQADRGEYLLLNAPEYVVYILPSSTEALDELAELGSGVTVRSVN